MISRLSGASFDIDSLRKQQQQQQQAQHLKQQQNLSDLRDAASAMKLLVSETLANAYEGGSDEELVRRLARLERYRLDFGDKYHDHRPAAAWWWGLPCPSC